MSQMSPRRRFAGRALLGLGVLALPLTASISYAASEAAQEWPEPPAPPARPAPPAPPAAPEAPQPPEAPEPPQAIDPAAPEAAGDVEVIERVIRGEDGKEKRVRMVFRGTREGGVPGEKLRHPEGAEWEAHGEMMAELRKELAEADRALAELPETVARAMAEAETARAAAPNVMVLKECNSAFRGQAEVIHDKDGKKTIMICQQRISATARLGLEQARAEIARDKDIPESTRKQLLETLDRQIARWKEKEG